MTLFARYYKNRKLTEVLMTEISTLIQDESNKKIIAEYIFHRYYDRYLKIFFFKSSNSLEYTKCNGDIVTKDEFEEEYKNGFSIMTNCCLLIETIASFFEGENKTQKSGSETFTLVFKKAKEYNNKMSVFENEKFYSEVRCGLLHQGETYGKFKIRRDCAYFDTTTKTINAKLFCDSLKDFLNSYQKELENAKWDDALWDNCRIKLRHIINNANQ